ncbi:MAG TPA: hypothetical protein IGS53_18315 [Leptolyngbyaceae cyanobacterium M33_DOE_097]|uniref:DUF6737 domain-containing protein n=1 Tax=Oscillatoriales cyanobacterium SpSt-418 TaxID=2282169 RepID=A0A7C3KJU9_9CYAN|nr:hypothetical protein [Leptolyngbyaceae cyanobacterium M33_DOE_097]
MVSDKSPSVWSLKPWWCQPWSILLTGFGLIAGSWLVFHRWWLTSLIALPLSLWMGYFLLVFPRLFEQAQIGQRSSEAEESG